MRYPFVRQHDEKDCGAACLSMISEYHGLKLTITKCRDLIKVDNLGANIYGIVTGAEQIELRAEALEGELDDLLNAIKSNEIEFPFVARIINEEMYEHFIVVYAIKNQKVYVGDPAKTKITTISLDLFLCQWQKQIITFSPTENFKTGNERKGTLNKFLKFVLNQKKTIAIVFITSLFISGISLFSATVFQYVLDDVVKVGDVNKGLTEESVDEHHTHTSDKSFIDKLEEKLSFVFVNLNTVCVTIIILYLIQCILQVFRGYILAVFSKNIETPISLNYYNHLVDLPAAFFGKWKTGELMSRFSDASNIRDAISSATLTIMLDTLMAVVTGVYLLTINHKLFIITSVVLVIYAVVMLLFKNPIKVINQNVMESNSRVTSYLKETVDGIETVKAYNYEASSKSQTKELFTNFVNYVVKGSVIYDVQGVLVRTVESIGLIVLLWVGAYLCIEDTITIGTLITFYYLLNYFLDPVKNLIELQPALQTAIVAAERLNDVLDVEVENNAKNDMTDLSGDIVMRDVDFKYGNRELVLKNINIKISSGQKVAIIGESGCGKTTLAKLLMNFYEPENGTITIDGKLLSQYSPKSIRNHIAYISQDTFIFSDTVSNNLKMGNQSISNSEIEKVCKMCCADSFIRELPFGYDTILEENGNNLSGGQKQRLAIARALLSKPDILIMDEATSNLDSITEESIKNIVSSLPSTMTVIIIAHRLSTIQRCDEIIVMDNGKVIESGTHMELMNKREFYYNLMDKE